MKGRAGRGSRASECSGSISSPHGRSVGFPYSSWFHQLPSRPIACATSRPGATQSISSGTSAPARRATARTDDHAGGDTAPDAETAVPDLERALPFRVRHLVPARGEVVEARTDDAGGDAPERAPVDEIPIPTARDPAAAGDPDAGRDREQQRQPVEMDRERAEIDRASCGDGIEATSVRAKPGTGYSRDARDSVRRLCRRRRNVTNECLAGASAPTRRSARA